VARFNELEMFNDSLPSCRATADVKAAKTPVVKRYAVSLNLDERERLEALIGKGKGPVQRPLKARIMLKPDASEAAEGWSDRRITEVLDTNASTVYLDAQAGGGRELRGGPEPQGAGQAARAAYLRRRKGKPDWSRSPAPSRPRAARAGACGFSRASGAWHC